MTASEKAQWMRKASRVCLGLLWIPFATLAIAVSGKAGMPGIMDGGQAWSDALTTASFLAMAPLFVGTFAFQIGAQLVAEFAQQRIVTEGELAKSTVLRIADTGRTIDSNPVIRLSLRVAPFNAVPFETDVDQVVSGQTAERLEPGETMYVKYFPKTGEIAVDDAKWFPRIRR